MLKMLAVIVVLVAALCVIRFGSKTKAVERAYASPAASTATTPAGSYSSTQAALQQLGEAIGDDGTDALPGQLEPALVKSPLPSQQRRAESIQRR